MTIVEAMKEEYSNARVSVGGRWLVWDIDAWVVYEHKYGKRKVAIVYAGTDEGAAVAALLDKEADNANHS